MQPVAPASRARTVTDNAGNFAFRGLPPGAYEPEASRYVQSQFLRVTKQVDLIGPASGCEKGDRSSLSERAVGYGSFIRYSVPVQPGVFAADRM
jgi:hypothetical protein